MCFSAPASFVAGTALTVIGVATLKKVKRPSQVPFAIIPLLFGVQQFTEGILWLTFTMDTPLLRDFMTYAFTGFSRVLWPVFVPFAVIALEPDRNRKKWILAMALAGITASLFLLHFILSTPMAAQIVGHHLVYSTPHLLPVPIMILYLLATCASSFFSSHRYVRIFGWLSLIGFAGAALVSYVALFSVWCFFAALLSSVIYLHQTQSRISDAEVRL